MNCPFCLHKKSDIYNSRSTKNNTVWRRRRCQQCHKVFTTQETWDPSAIWMVQNKKGMRPYNRATLFASILRACDHRSTQAKSAWYLLQAAEVLLCTVAVSGSQLITRQEIINQVSILLKRFDPTAYIKYLSYHQPAMDVTTLRRQLRKG